MHKRIYTLDLYQISVVNLSLQGGRFSVLPKASTKFMCSRSSPYAIRGYAGRCTAESSAFRPDPHLAPLVMHATSDGRIVSRLRPKCGSVLLAGYVTADRHLETFHTVRGIVKANLQRTKRDAFSCYSYHNTWARAEERRGQKTARCARGMFALTRHAARRPFQW